MTSYENEFKDTVKRMVTDICKDEIPKAFDAGWNAAVLTISQSIENMKVFGDTAASFAIFVKEFTRGDMAFPNTTTTDTEEQQPTKVQPKQ